MKILAPLNRVEEVIPLIKAGADELYCGVISQEWRIHYTNIGSPNRREWSSANITSYQELEKIINIAHKSNISVWITLNAFYTQAQEDIIKQEIQNACNAGVDGFIVADLGIMHYLKNSGILKERKLIVSTCATNFNSWSVEFYKRFLPYRITLPRQLTLKEIKKIRGRYPEIEFEVFVLNSGCKNIDGFCTFHHGVSEHLYANFWNIFKKFNLDLKILEQQRKHPLLFEGINRFIKGVDSACLLDYKIEILSDIKGQELSRIKSNIKRNFSLYTGIDPCRACEISELIKAGVNSFKIVGRNYPTAKKVKDVRFLKAVTELALSNISEEFESAVKELFEKIYHYPCTEVCYHR